MSEPRKILEVNEVTKRFGGIVALDGLSLSLLPGELRCILGPNGCGKTTLFNILTGAFSPTSGSVKFRGEEISGKAPADIARLGISRKFQVPGIYLELSVDKNIELPLAAANRHPSVLSLLRHRRSSESIEKLKRFAGLTEKGHVPAGELSQGEKQKVEMAMLLATGADLLLLDEPTAGMSGAETSAIATLVRQLTTELGKSVLVIEHDMNFVRELACPVTVMARGKAIAHGSYDDIRSDPAVIECYLGRAA